MTIAAVCGADGMLPFSQLIEIQENLTQEYERSPHDYLWIHGFSFRCHHGEVVLVPVRDWNVRPGYLLPGKDLPRNRDYAQGSRDHGAVWQGGMAHHNHLVLLPHRLAFLGGLRFLLCLVRGECSGQKHSLALLHA